MEAGAAWARGRAAGLHSEMGNFLLPASIQIAQRARRKLLRADLEQQRARALDLGELRRQRGRGGHFREAERVAELLPAGRPQLGDRAGQAAHPAERAGPLGGADRATRVEHVERVGALEHVVVRGHGQARVQHPTRLGGVLLEQPRPLLLSRDAALVVEAAGLVRVVSRPAAS